MATLSKLLLEKEILLESGTNELEVLVFRVAGYTFGINVAKVREVLPAPTVVSLPKAHASVMGVFKLRDRVIPVVSLRKHLQIDDNQATERAVILTDFNQHQTAFEVDVVERIHRLSWEQILAVPAMMALASTPVTSVARIDTRLVILLDFEMISDQVMDRIHVQGMVENRTSVRRENMHVLLADDSSTVRQAMGDTLRNSGYQHITIFESGAQAWNWIEQRFRETGDVRQVADLLISDIEMPQIDGHHLCKRIKSHPQLSSIPVVLYSSIITPENRRKGEAVGADAQVTKPELKRVVEVADQLIARIHAAQTSPAPHAVATAAPAKVAALSTANAVTQSEPAPAPSSAPPANIDARLWHTFRAELRDRARQLTQLCQRAGATGADEALRNEIKRALHTVKSASQVVPLEQVANVTHLFETRLTNLHAAWPHAELTAYVEWLTELADPLTAEPNATLAEGNRLLTLLQAGRSA